MSKLRLIRASAGSGKTYTIAAAYLRLLFRYPANYRHILAVTFTNKATAEMKGRILLELFKIASNKPSHHTTDLCNEFQLSQNQLQEKALFILNSVLHNYSRFTISTIDSFFQRIIKAFAREAGLQANFDVELNVETVLNDATNTLLNSLENDAQLLEWLAAFAETLIEDGKSWDFRKKISNLGKELFNEKFASLSPEFRHIIANREKLKEIHESLIAVQSQFVSDIKKTGAGALAIIAKHGLEPASFKYGLRGGVGVWFQKMAAGNIAKPGKYVTDACADFNACVPKDKNEAAMVLAAGNDGLIQLLQKVTELYEAPYVLYESCHQVTKNFYTLGILSDLSRAIGENSQAENMFVLANSGPFLKAIIGENDAPFIYEKAGQTYHHFMIDEFQDTSGIQWNNFKPLIGESLAAGNNCMLVGDAKQSIYRWRNTDWEIMASQVETDLGSENVQIENLKFNWRSKSNIIAFNNSLFEVLLLLARNILENTIPNDINNAGRIKLIDLPLAAYQGAMQHFPPGAVENQGNVQLRFFDGIGSDWTQQSLEALPPVIEQLYEQGYALKDMAILVRTAKEGKEVFDFFNNYKLENSNLSNCPFHVLSNESAFVANNRLVKLFVSVFQYIAFPDDKINFTALLNLWFTLFPKQAFWGIHLLPENLFNIIENKQLLANIANELNRLKGLPPDELFEHINSKLPDTLPAYHLPFIQAFHDSVLLFVASHPPSVQGFLEFWETHSEKLSVAVPEQQDAIRILTIHKSKGLEFKNVFVPFCNWPLDHFGNKGPILWCAHSQPPLSSLQAFPVKYSKELTNTVFATAYYTEKAQMLVDNINLLYVAFTRAAHNLFVFSEMGNSEKLASKTGNLLYSAVSQALPLKNSEGFPVIELWKLWNETQKQFQLSEKHTPENISLTSNEAVNLLFLHQYPSHDISGRLRQKPLTPFYGTDNALPDGRKAYGNFMHNLFQMVKTTADIEPAIMQLVNAGLVAKTDSEALKTHVMHLLSNEPYCNWFGPHWQVLNEASIIVPQNTQYRPDRVMINEKTAIVIDYKFGLKERPQYIEQVQNYMQCLSEMAYSPVEGYVWYVGLNKLVKVE